MTGVDAEKSPKPSLKPSNDVDQALDRFYGIVDWITSHAVVSAVIAAVVLLPFGWAYARKVAREKGKELPELAPLIGKYFSYWNSDDDRPLLTRPTVLAARIPWLTGKRGVVLGTIAGIAALATNHVLAGIIVLAVTFYGLSKRGKMIFTGREQAIRVMFDVAKMEFKYPKGAELNPQSWIKVQTWKNYTQPQATVIMIPAGWRSEEASNRDKFERNWKATITDQHSWDFQWEPAAGTVTTTPIPPLPTMAPHPGITQPRKWNEIPLGVTYGGKEVVVDLEDCPHFLVAGSTGGGKSVTQRNFLLHALTHPQFRVIGLDPKRVELTALKDASQPNGLKPNVMRLATDLESMTRALEEAEAEMMRRYTEMENAGGGINHATLLPTPPPALLVMIDETFALLAKEGVKSDEGKERDEMHDRCVTLVGSIARLGRAAMVHLVCATQRPDAKMLPGETKLNLAGRIACGPMDTTPSMMVLDSEDATRTPPIKGRTILKQHATPTEFQGYFLDSAKFDALVAAGRQVYATGGSAPLAMTSAPAAAPPASKRRLPRLKRTPTSDTGGSVPTVPGLPTGGLWDTPTTPPRRSTPPPRATDAPAPPVVLPWEASPRTPGPTGDDPDMDLLA